MIRREFPENETYLPLTMKQFEDLTNEILAAVNELSAPHFLSADYICQVLMSAIHAMKHEIGVVKKSDLFESCVNRISCHITYDVVKDLQLRLKAEKAQAVEGAPSQTLAPVVPIIDTDDSA